MPPEPVNVQQHSEHEEAGNRVDRAPAVAVGNMATDEAQKPTEPDAEQAPAAGIGTKLMEPSEHH